jgi:hypothetical protein
VSVSAIALLAVSQQAFALDLVTKPQWALDPSVSVSAQPNVVVPQTQPYNQQLPGEVLPQQSNGFKLKQLPKIEPGPPLNYDNPDGGAPKPPPPPPPKPDPNPKPDPGGVGPFNRPCPACPPVHAWGDFKLLNVQPDQYRLNVQPNQYRLQRGLLLQR